MKRVTKLLSALLTIALGVLFIIFKTDILSICMTVLGVGLIVLAVLDLIRFKVITAIIEGIIGVAVLVIGWTILDIALFVLAVVLGIYGIVELLRRIFEKKKRKKHPIVLAIGFVEPILCMAVAAILLFNSGAALSWVMILAGVLLLIDGILSLVVALAGKRKKKKRA